jgi:hypothetical protein
MALLRSKSHEKIKIHRLSCPCCSLSSLLAEAGDLPGDGLGDARTCTGPAWDLTAVHESSIAAGMV